MWPLLYANSHSPSSGDHLDTFPSPVNHDLGQPRWWVHTRWCGVQDHNYDRIDRPRARARQAVMRIGRQNGCGDGLIMWVCLVKSLLQGYNANSLVGGQNGRSGMCLERPEWWACPRATSFASLIRTRMEPTRGRGMDALSSIGSLIKMAT